MTRVMTSKGVGGGGGGLVLLSMLLWNPFARFILMPLNCMICIADSIKSLQRLPFRRVMLTTDSKWSWETRAVIFGSNAFDWVDKSEAKVVLANMSVFELTHPHARKLSWAICCDCCSCWRIAWTELGMVAQSSLVWFRLRAWVTFHEALTAVWFNKRNLNFGSIKSHKVFVVLEPAGNAATWSAVNVAFNKAFTVLFTLARGLGRLKPNPCPKPKSQFTLKLKLFNYN